MTILVDTCMWVDHLREPATSLGRALAAGESVSYTEPILMEMLMGARNDAEWRRLRRFIGGANLLPFESIADFEAGARINRRGRANGITVGKFDCLILAVAKRTGAALMTRDRRQAQLARLIDVGVLD
jgi:predicted nucleic acid-binding protein